MHDLVVIGAGPAGISASVYAARKRINTLVVTKDIGGQAALSGDVENYTGYQFISGAELMQKFSDHMHKYDIELIEGKEVIDLKKGTSVYICTEEDEFEAKTVIIASGKRLRRLNVPGEDEFKNRGLTYCATCDGPLFTGKDVAIIGGGNSALDAALQMINIARRVYIINIASSLTGDEVMLSKIIKDKKVTVFNNSQVTSILGDKFVTGIEFEKDNKGQRLSVEGVFVEVGLIPNSDFAKIVDKNEFGEIKVDSYNNTNIPGIFAAGDVTDVPEKQIIIAAGEGAKAALSAFRYLSHLSS